MKRLHMTKGEPKKGREGGEKLSTASDHVWRCLDVNKMAVFVLKPLYKPSHNALRSSKIQISRLCIDLFITEPVKKGKYRRSSEIKT